MKKPSRRKFLTYTGFVGGSLCFGNLISCRLTSNKKSKAETESAPTVAAAKNVFSISLAQWSLHRAHFDGKMTALDFAQVTRKEYGLDAIEYVNQFFKDKAEQRSYLKELKTRANGEGVKSLLIMIDGEGKLGATDNKERKKAVENHYKWVEAAKFLDCHSIRVNAAGDGDADAVSKAAVQGLRDLSLFAKDFDLNVIVENHGGHSSNGKWMSDVMKQVNLPNCGTLPDFGNFCIEHDDAELYQDRKCLKSYDRYQGVKELMPFAKAVSAKSFDFNKQGEVIETDFHRMMDIVLEAGYHGYVGIEYEGFTLSEKEGIQKTIALLKKIKGEN